MSTTATNPTSSIASFLDDARTEKILAEQAAAKSAQTAQAEKLAKDYAKVRGFEGRTGGWIYSPAGRPVAHGWSAFTAILLQRRRIVNIDGRLWINWRADDTHGVIR